MSGPTGLLGEYLLKDLVLAGWNVAVLCRSAPGSKPSDRIEHLLGRWEETLSMALPRPVVIESDITCPNLGIASEDLRWIQRHCNSFLHNAASLTFDANREDGEPWLSNLIGTQHAIQVCKLAAIKSIFHVSTAYVCGRRTGAILESELDLGQSFATEYEASKCASELEWKQAAFENLTILRPAIIVGDSKTGYTSTYHGFYAPLKSMATLLAQGFGSGAIASPGHANGNSVKATGVSGGDAVDAIALEAMLAALGLSGAEEKNFVPVEWVSQVIVSVASTPTAWNKVYHLTPIQRTSARAAAHAMQRSLLKHFASKQQASLAAVSKVESTSLQSSSQDASESSQSDWSTFGKAFSNQVSVYQEYWRDDPVFDATNRLSFTKQTGRPDLDCPLLDDETLESLCDFAIQSGFGWPKRRIPTQVDSITKWLQERALSFGSVAEGLVQLNALGPGGGTVVIGFDSAGKLVFEYGVATDLPRVLFGFVQLRDFVTFTELEKSGLAWVQLPGDSADSIESLCSDVGIALEILDRIATNDYSATDTTHLVRN